MLCRQTASTRAASSTYDRVNRLQLNVRQSSCRRSLRCWAKTTSSRSKTTSSSDSSTTAKQPLQQQPQQLTPNSSKSLQDRLGGVGERFKSVVHFLTPKQEGDIGDVLMMSLSMAVLIYFSMQLYRLYAYAYFHAGSYQTMMDMMQQ